MLLQKWAQRDLHPNKFSPLVQFSQLSNSEKLALLFHSGSERLKEERGVLRSARPPGFKVQAFAWKLVEQTFPSQLNPAPPAAELGTAIAGELAKHSLATGTPAAAHTRACRRGKDPALIISSVWPF